MLYARFQAWKTQTRGKRGWSLVIVLASSIASWKRPASFMSLARIQSMLTNRPRKAPIAMPRLTSGGSESSARSVVVILCRPAEAAIAGTMNSEPARLAAMSRMETSRAFIGSAPRCRPGPYEGPCRPVRPRAAPRVPSRGARPAGSFPLGQFPE
jgi:hypothetical protein